MPGRNGPHNYWSEDAPPSRGQWKTIAELALELLQEQLPKSRLDASLLTGALRAALEQGSPESIVPESDGTLRTNGASSKAVVSPAAELATRGALSAAGRASGSSRASRTGVRTAASIPTEAG